MQRFHSVLFWVMLLLVWVSMFFPYARPTRRFSHFDHDFPFYLFVDGVSEFKSPIQCCYNKYILINLHMVDNSTAITSLEFWTINSIKWFIGTWWNTFENWMHGVARKCERPFFWTRQKTTAKIEGWRDKHPFAFAHTNWKENNANNRI